jgi:uncharacterized alkaline shock family protein YloU
VTDIARTPLGRIAVDPKAVSRLVQHAAESADGARVVRAGRTLSVSLGEDRAATVAVTITVARRVVLPELGALVQQRIAAALRTALDTPSARVEVTIDGIHAEGDG